MERRSCKGIGGIHWDEMIIKEGIVLLTGKLVGFEDENIAEDYNVKAEKLNLNKNDSESSDYSSSESLSAR